MERIALAASLAALLLLALGRWGIARLVRLGLRQQIREDAPARHQQKAGVPTMGGLLILGSLLITVLAVGRPITGGAGVVLIAMLGYAVVGGIDDLLAVRRGRNLGLRARERLAVQIPLAVLVGLYVMFRSEFGSALQLPWIGPVDLGWGYLAFAALYIVGFANAVNITDGLDGLAGGTVAIAAAAYGAIALQRGQVSSGVLAAALAGACLAFVWFNAHPAAVIMGDVGSNALGAGLAAVAIITKTELTLFIVGAVFVIEAASVLLQIGYFKLTGGRRIFRMSPLHHHFELAGWSETQTVMRFWIAGAFAALLGLTIVF
ncbi:MAG TPA: phospho-N-acetylmuramoyl-pentapeptide-transferase [bacterium]|nr:phospho-N-acetylmuramoyl-pentapeptide-transferase [bacterium]